MLEGELRFAIAEAFLGESDHLGRTIDAYDPALGHALCQDRRHPAVAAADVQDGLVSREIQAADQLLGPRLLRA